MVKWYEDKKRTSYIAVYKNEKEMRREVDEATKFGWAPVSADGTDGHINVARTAARMALLVGLFSGASRSKGKVTVTWRRETAN